LAITVGLVVHHFSQMHRSMEQFEEALRQATEGQHKIDLALKPSDPFSSHANLLELFASQFRAETAMRSRLSGATDHMLDGLVVLNATGQIIQTNQVAEKLFQKTSRELADHPIQGYLAEDNTQTKTSGLMARLKATHGIMRPDGQTVPVTLTARPMTSALTGQREIVCVIRDMSDIAAHEQDLNKVRDLAEESNRVKAEFLDNINHELRTPLNAVIGFSEMFQNELFGPLGNEKYLQYANQINKSGHHLLGIVNDIMDLSKMVSGKQQLNFGEIPPGDLARNSLAITDTRAWEKGVSLGLILDKELPQSVLVDGSALKRVLTHLLRNGVQHTESGGSVTLIVSRAGPELEMVIEDTGCGMSADEIIEAIKPFRQANNAHTRANDGAGLGLPISKQLIELHGGSFRIDSSPGKGTRVILMVPMSPPAHLIKAA